MANWYAQIGSTNINSVSSGTTSSVWNSAKAGGGSWLSWGSQGSSDIFVANGQTGLIINVDPALPTGYLTTDGVDYSGNNGGSFTLACSLGLTINCNISADTSGSTTVPCITLSGSSGTTTINGNLYNGYTSCPAISITATTGATVNVNGTLYASTGGITNGAINISGTCILNITATTAISAGSNRAFQVLGNATVNITGNITTTAINAWGIWVNSAAGCTINITGNISAVNSSSSYGIQNQSAGSTITVNGNVSAGGTLSPAIYSNSSTSFTLTVNGNITGGLAIKWQIGTFTLNGSISSGAQIYGYTNAVTLNMNGGTITGNSTTSPIAMDSASSVVTFNKCNFDLSSSANFLSIGFINNPGSGNWIQYMGINSKKIKQYFLINSIGGGARNRTRSRLGSVTI